MIASWLALNVHVVIGLLIAGVCVFVAGWIAHREVVIYRRANRTVRRRREAREWPPW